jgi:hypothetical protein
MNIKNKYCRLSSLNQDQIDKLVELMPDDNYFDFHTNDFLIGFSRSGKAGTWRGWGGDEIITYKDMLSLLGAEEEQLVPHIHQKEIIAWANGEEIEVKSMFDKESWFLSETPLWRKRCQYRVKPKLTLTQLRIAEKEKELSSLKYQDAVERGVNIVLGEVDASN